jgi:hypothetical protein
MTPTREHRCACTLPDHWTSEQALAIADFLNDLREAIWAHYYEQLDEAYRKRTLFDYLRPDTTPDGSSSEPAP